jgi:hypothetical protein
MPVFLCFSSAAKQKKQDNHKKRRFQQYDRWGKKTLNPLLIHS